MKLRILETIGKVFEESKRCHLEDAFFIKIDQELSFLASYFRTTKSQAFFIALVFALNYKGESVDFNDLIDYLDCNPMTILKHNDDLNDLYAKGIFKKEKSRHRINLSGTNDQFTINQQISEAILDNKPMPELNKTQKADFAEFLEELYNLGQQRDEETISTSKLLIETEIILSTNSHFPFLQKIDKFNLNVEDIYLYLYMIWKALLGDDSIDIGRTMEAIYDKASWRIKRIQEILNDESALLKYELIETTQTVFFNETNLKLTDKSTDILKEYGISILMSKKTNKDNILKPSKIKPRELFFSDMEMEQLFMFKDLLDDKKLNETKKRLAEKNLPTGITAILHGAPGTGKTEIVKQIARETQRDLMKVEISKSKSAWFGESEKIIKRIFTEYKSFSEDCERSPILFFNEADAIISKRKVFTRSSVSQTENAIQNILLEELENFEGILIATTNLVQNLDPAFERRFLFKIRFYKPNQDIRARIWKSKLPFLDKQDCMALAEKYDFSGGQIDNIMRKSEIYEVIHGRKASIANLMDYCAEETLADQRVMIGFGK